MSFLISNQIAASSQYVSYLLVVLYVRLDIQPRFSYWPMRSEEIQRQKCLFRSGAQTRSFSCKSWLRMFISLFLPSGKRARPENNSITATFEKSLFITQYWMRYAIYILLNANDFTIDLTMCAHKNRQNAIKFARANNCDLLRALKHLIKTRFYGPYLDWLNYLLPSCLCTNSLFLFL